MLGKILPVIKNVVHLQRKRKIAVIGLWCNGNTTDSGPVILGSNPSSPTAKSSSHDDLKTFFIVSPKILFSVFLK